LESLLGNPQFADPRDLENTLILDAFDLLGWNVFNAAALHMYGTLKYQQGFNNAKVIGEFFSDDVQSGVLINEGDDYSELGDREEDAEDASEDERQLSFRFGPNSAN
jgi:hypothetical protein